MSTGAKNVSEEILWYIRNLPRFWHGSGTISGSVVTALSTLPRVEYSVETGTGKSTLIFSQLSQHHVVFAKDDAGDGDSLQRVRESNILNAGNVEFVVGPTQKTLPSFQFNKPIDIAFLDGPHGYPFPELEYLAIYPHLKPGGLLIIDDCHIPTIARLVDFIKADKMFRLERRVYTTLFFRRTDAPVFCPTDDGWEKQDFNQKRFPSIRHVPPILWPRLLMPQSAKKAIRWTLDVATNALTKRT